MKDFILNKELNEKEINNKKLILESKPIRLMILLTTICNLDCIMCNRIKTGNFTIPPQAIKKIYSVLPYITWMNWQGGEVFLIDYFKQLFLDVCNFGHIQQSILTNGLLIDEEWAKILSEFNVEITYSIDAVTKDTYEKIRKKAKFSDLIKSIELINKYRIKYHTKSMLGITTVVMKSNYKELYLIPEFCKKYGFTHLRFDYLHPHTAHDEDIILKRNPEAVDYLRKVLPEIEIKCQDLNIHFCYTFKEFLYDNIEENNEYKLNHNQTLLNRKCTLPWQQLALFPTQGAEVRPDCACIHPVGNLINDTIEEIWNSKMMQLYRYNLITGNIKSWCSEKCIIDMGYSPY